MEQHERKLLDRYYAERVSQRLYDQEQERFTRERIAAEKMIANLTIDHDRLLAALDIALLLTKDIQAAYHQANEAQRRLFNQAFFERLEVDGVEITGHKLSEPYAQLLAYDLIEGALPDSIAAEVETDAAKLDGPTAVEPADDEKPNKSPPARPRPASLPGSALAPRNPETQKPATFQRSPVITSNLWWS